MTEKLFEKDSFMLKEDCTVLSCLKTDGGFAVYTDRTVFFPEGGGQPGDRGRLGQATVLDTGFDRNGEIFHLCDRPLTPQQRYNMEVDGNFRLDNIQQHTGEHMLSYAFWHLFGINNVGFHMNSDLATIDLDREVSKQEIIKAEHFANGQIYQNLPIKAYYSPLSQLKNKKVRKISQKGGDNPRVVEIEGGDICTCCGTHANFTGTVGIIKVIKCEKNRQGSRLEFLCGKRALNYIEAQLSTAREAAEMFSTEFSELPGRIKDLKQHLCDVNLLLKQKTEALADYTVREICDGAQNGLAVALLEGVGGAEARVILNKAVKSAECVVLIYRDKDRINYVLSSREDGRYDCKYLCELLNGLYSGKGGGSKTFAQGGGRFCPDYREREEIFVKTAVKNI